MNNQLTWVLVECISHSQTSPCPCQSVFVVELFCVDLTTSAHRVGQTRVGDNPCREGEGEGRERE